MTQSDFGTIDPNTKNGTELATDLNTFRDAQNTLHRGSSVPSYAQGGIMWIDDSGAPTWIIKLNDGTDDLTLFTVDITANTVALSFDTIALTDAGTLASLSVIRSGASPTANMVFFEDSAAANSFSNLEIKAARPGLIFRDSTVVNDDFRLGINGNLFKISIDSDDDDIRDSSGHFDDFPNAFVMDGVTGFVGFNRAPTVALDLGGTVSGGDVRSLVENTSNTAGSTASLQLKVGGTTAQDPQLFFTIPSGSSWVMGVNNNDSDRFTLSLGASLGASNAVAFDSSLNAEFAGTVTITGDLEVTGGDITSSSGAISFGNENLSTTGTFGVGTTSPDGKVHIESSSAGAIAPVATADELILESSGNTGMTIYSGLTSTGNIFFGTSGDDDPGRFQYDHNADRFQFITNNAERLRMDTVATEFNVTNANTNFIINTDGTADALLINANGSGQANGLATWNIPVEHKGGFGRMEAPVLIAIDASDDLTITDEDDLIEVTTATSSTLNTIIGGFNGQKITLALALTDTMTMAQTRSRKTRRRRSRK